MPYHVTVGENRYVIEQNILLQDFLSKQDGSAIILVKLVEYVERGTVVYGNMSGCIPIPGPVSEEVLFTSTNINHLTTSVSPI